MNAWKRALRNCTPIVRIIALPYAERTRMIKVFGMASPNLRKVTMTLRELGVPFEFWWVEVFSGEQFSPTFLSMNPNNKVPVLIDEDGPDGETLTLFESGAIMIYLAEKFGALLPPQNTSARYEVLKWIMIQKTGYGPMCGQFTHFSHFAPDGNDYALERYRREVMRISRVFEKRLSESDWIGGAEYSIADIALFPWILRHEARGLSWDGFEHLPRWLETVSARPAVQATLSHIAELSTLDGPRLQTATPEMLDIFTGRRPLSANTP